MTAVSIWQNPAWGSAMPRSSAQTVAEYLKELPEDRRKVVAALRKLIRKNLPKGYEESMDWGMISYAIPLSRYPKTYNGRPLAYAALAAQKNHFAVYLMNVDAEKAAFLRREFAKAGKKLDMGRGCVRFKSLDDLPLEAIGKVIASTPPDQHIARFEASRRK
jgi:uncharacterized protein YdhG (YjbR/CyaY superfamily)